MRELRTSGSVGGRGGQLPRSTRLHRAHRRQLPRERLDELAHLLHRDALEVEHRLALLVAHQHLDARPLGEAARHRLAVLPGWPSHRMRSARRDWRGWTRSRRSSTCAGAARRVAGAPSWRPPRRQACPEEGKARQALRHEEEGPQALPEQEVGLNSWRGSPQGRRPDPAAGSLGWLSAGQATAWPAQALGSACLLFRHGAGVLQPLGVAANATAQACVK